jgi:hypothetical protein
MLAGSPQRTNRGGEVPEAELTTIGDVSLADMNDPGIESCSCGQAFCFDEPIKVSLEKLTGFA